MTGGTRRARWLVLVTMCAGYFLVLLDVTVVNVALLAIQGGTGAGVSGLQWVVDGYAIALAALLLAAGALRDLRGHRRIVLLGLGLLAAAVTAPLVPAEKGRAGAHVDYAGAVLGALALAAATFAIVSGELVVLAARSGLASGVNNRALRLGAPLRVG